MGILNLRHGADALTLFRACCALMLPFRPSVRLLLFAVVSDWLDGPLARRAGPTVRGAQLDLEADSLLTLGAAIAAVRSGAPRVVLLAPAARYAIQVVRPVLDADEARWDRRTGIAQMIVLAGAIAGSPVARLALPVSAVRSAVLAARGAPR